MFKAYPHQRKVQDKMKRMEALHGGGFLCDEMGMGKTITMAMHLTSKRLANPDLIVCPNAVIGTWEKWLKEVGGDNISVLVYHGPKRKTTLEKQNQPIDFVITTYHTLSTNELVDRAWGRIVLDESHTIRNMYGKNPSKCAKGAMVFAKKAQKRWCVSGTPFMNRYKDIAAQCHFVGTRPFNSVDWWKNASDERKSAWSMKHVIRRTKENMLAEPIYHNIAVEHTDSERKRTSLLCDKVKRQIGAYAQTKEDGGNLEDICGQLNALLLKLRMCSNSYCCKKKVKVKYLMKKNAKIKTIVSQIQALPDVSGIVIFSQFTSFLDLLKQVFRKHLPERQVFEYNGKMSTNDRDTTVERFNTSTSKRVILVSLMAGGVGLSLHHNASHVMLCEPYYNPFIEQQAEERVHRLGQTERVEVFRFYVTHSVDSWMNQMKVKKAEDAKVIGVDGTVAGEEEYVGPKKLGEILKEYVL